MNNKTDDLFEVQYEEGFLERSIPGGIMKYPDVAITELIANAHDAGATKVEIFIPAEVGGLLVVEDNGVGMSENDFKSRWMKLSYNRILHQGDKVTFPDELKHIKRKAFGRNGVGRHGLICFGDNYVVETWCQGSVHKFTLSAIQSGEPLTVVWHESGLREGHGTRLSVVVDRNLKSSDSIHEILSHRFFSMSDFSILVNGREVKLSDHPGMIDETTIQIDGNTYKVTLVDTKLSRRDSYFQGEGIWVGGRRVGDQDWRLGSVSFTDGRKSFSKRYAIIVETEDALRDEILPDWSGFKPKSEAVNSLAAMLLEYIQKKRRELLSDEMNIIKEEALDIVRKEFEQLPDIARADVSDFIDQMLNENPELDVNTLELAVKAAINLERAHLGQNLLLKLTTIDPEDVNALDAMLDDWSARDAAKALNEIDARLKVIEALKRLSGDKSADELHTIHPLVLRAKWLFGYEYEATSYSSNVGLVKTIEKVFGKDIDKDAFINPMKRPDIVILKKSSLSGYAVSDIDSDNLLCVKKVLLIEVKRGNFPIGRNEMFQAQGYVEDILNCGILSPKPIVTAFVIGETVDPNMSPRVEIKDANEVKYGEVIAKPFAALISTAEARLFQLRETLNDRYVMMKTDDLKRQSLTVNVPLPV